MCDSVGKRRNRLSTLCGLCFSSCNAMYAPTLCPMTIKRGLSSVNDEKGGDAVIVSRILTLFSICS